MKCGQKHFMSQTRVAPVLFISLEIAPAANKRELMWRADAIALFALLRIQ